VTHANEAHFRSHGESLADRPVDRDYDDVRGASYLGQIASENPNFLERGFNEVESEGGRSRLGEQRP
jgi:hypothetical protein